MRKKTHPLHRPIRLGFVALVDSAPLIMAQELGLFEKYDVEVELHREVGWATIRDKVIYGELEAAHAPAGLVVSASCGLGSIQADCLTALVLNLQGNAITLSESLWRRGVRDGHTLRQVVSGNRERLTLGVVHPFSAHNCLLRLWLREHGLEPVRDVQIVVVPPAQVHANLKAGHLDGYCVGEPWNSMAVLSRTGWCVATSLDLAPRHPEKVLMVRKTFAERMEREHLALVAALLEACAFCEKPANRERLIETLAQPEYIGAPIQSLAMGMGGTFDYGYGRVEKHHNFHVFAGTDVNEPSPDKAKWVLENLLSAGLVPDPTVLPRNGTQDWFRADLHRQALTLNSTTTK